MYSLASNRSTWQLILAIVLILVFIALTVLTNSVSVTGHGANADSPAITPVPDQSRASNQPHETGESAVTGESRVTEDGVVTGDGMVYQPPRKPSVPKPCGAAVGALPHQSSSAEAANHTRDPRDMKILVIASDGKESDYLALLASLDRIGVPYDVLIATQMTLTADLLWDGVSHGCYQGIMLTTGNLTYYNSATQAWESAFSSDEWLALWQYEAMFGVRQVTSYTYPGWPESYGLNYVSYQDTGVAPLQVHLTSAGEQIFPYLNSSNPILVKNARVYLTTDAVSATTSITPLLTAPNPNGPPYIVAAIKRYNDGRENLIVMAENNPNLLHTLLLSYGLVNWLTDGIFLGERHVAMDIQPDDVFISNMMWDSSALRDTSGMTFRMSPDDLTALINWQNTMRARFPVAADLKLEMPFVGAGGSGLYSPDTLTPALIANQAHFNWINHTFHHVNLDNITADTAMTELQLNDDFARKSGFSTYTKETMIQPDISGLDNEVFKQAAYEFGIRYLIADTSRPEWNNPTPNTGFYSVNQPDLLIIPRHATSLFYNVRTPEEWVSEYNCYYGPEGTCANGARRYWDHNLDYAEILDRESDRLLQYLLKWDIDPLMFHQPNLGTYDGVHSLLGDLIEATLRKYSSMYTLPIQNLTLHQVGKRMANRMSYNTSKVVATLYPGSSIKLTTVNNAVIPVTGVAYGDSHEVYGGQSISYITMSSNQLVSVPLTGSVAMPPQPPSSELSPTQSSLITDTLSAAYLLPRVADAMNAFQRGQLDATIDYLQGNGSHSQARIQFEFGTTGGDQRLRMVTMYQGDKSKQTNEQITIGETTWNRQDIGPWNKTATQTSIREQVQPFLPNINTITNPTITSNETTITLRWYDTASDAEMTLTVDPAMGVPQQLRKRTRVTGSMLIVNYSGWNTVVDITLPATK